VRKFVPILLTATYLLSTTQICELFKISILVEHYFEHRVENVNLTFIDFLEVHYNGQNTKDADYEKDMKLPFKTCDNMSLFNNFSCILNPSFEISPKKNSCTSSQSFLLYEFQHTSDFLSFIWQPPKFS
jgi:hypothetical protein